MKNVTIIILAFIVGLSTTSCSSLVNDVERFGFNITNQSAEVTCYSGGQVILKTKTKGKVTDSPDSDGFYFQSQDSVFYETTGDCVFKYDP
jgi:hypothetical protein